MDREGIKKHKAVFDAWLNGAEIEARVNDEEPWGTCAFPSFVSAAQYRVAVRDWAWACKQMLEGKRVTWPGMKSYLTLHSGVIMQGVFFPEIERGYLTATDWRLVD